MTRTLTALCIDEEQLGAAPVGFALSRIPGIAARLMIERPTDTAEIRILSSPPDVIFVNAAPSGSRAEMLVRGLRRRGLEQPIVLLTGSFDDDLAERCRAAGANAHLRRSELTPERIREVLETPARTEVGRAPDPATPVAPLISEPSHPPFRFLLVEDNEDHALLTTLALEESGEPCTVERVGDGMQALAFLTGTGAYVERTLPDAILLDLKLPRMSGHELLERLKADQRFCGIPVIVLTSSASPADRHRATRHHANGYLVKPPDFESMTHMMQAVKSYWARWNAASPRPRT